jgi:hypothetical protein
MQLRFFRVGDSATLISRLRKRHYIPHFTVDGSISTTLITHITR